MKSTLSKARDYDVSENSDKEKVPPAPREGENRKNEQTLQTKAQESKCHGSSPQQGWVLEDDTQRLRTRNEVPPFTHPVVIGFLGDEDKRLAYEGTKVPPAHPSWKN